VYDAKTGREINHVPTGQIEINATVFAPDGKTIATSGDDETIRLLDAVDGKPRLRISGPKGRHAFSVLFTPSGGQIVTTWNDPVIRIFNTRRVGGRIERLQRYSQPDRTRARRQDAGVGERRWCRTALVDLFDPSHSRF
jgi:WD40 repeat protein